MIGTYKKIECHLTLINSFSYDICVKVKKIHNNVYINYYFRFKISNTIVWKYFPTFVSKLGDYQIQILKSEKDPTKRIIFY